MPLDPGTRLGPYEIVAPLGAGGMGEVYRARDPRLQREVAIKVLPAATAADPEALARFGREARAVAALAHPNLLAIYDVGSQGGVAYAVTELLEGATLREHLAAGPLAARDALALARPIALGLAAAHEKGIVHRDLKPENLFVSRDGHVKILDFGLAKRVFPADRGRASGIETVTSATLPGAIVGTLGYMAPEQLCGQPVDARADVFSFGAVLFEMLAGRRAFAGGSEAAVIAAVLTQPPPASSADRPFPAALASIVQRCLAKDPAERYASARELADALRGAGAAPEPGAPSAPGSANAGTLAGAPKRARASGWGVVGVLAGAIVVIVALGFVIGRRPIQPPVPAPARVPAREQAVAMLEFENLSGDRSLDWIGRGLPELLGSALARSAQLDVYDPQRLANLLEPRGRAPDTATSIYGRLREHGVGRAVVGSILRSGGTLSIQCRVMDMESGRVLHADVSQGTVTADIFQLAGGLIPKLQTWLEIDLAGAGAADRWLREITTSSSDAYRLYLRGHEAMMASRWRESAGYDEQALALDSTFVAARMDLTGCVWNLGDETRTQLSLAAARRLRGRVSPREGLQLDMIEAVIAGDPDGLIRTASSLHELYPENRFFTYLLGRGYFTASRWDRCIETLEPLVRERWTWAWTYILCSRAYEKLGRLVEARNCFETGMGVTRRNPELALAYAAYRSAHGDVRGGRELLLEASRSPEMAETPEFESQVRLALGRLYETEGKADSARIQYARVLAVAPRSSDDAKSAAAGARRTKSPR